MADEKRKTGSSDQGRDASQGDQGVTRSSDFSSGDTGQKGGSSSDRQQSDSGQSSGQERNLSQEDRREGGRQSGRKSE